MKIKIQRTFNCGYYISDGNGNYLWKDIKLYRSTGYGFVNKYKYGDAPGYYPTEAIAQAYLDEYLSRNQIKEEQKMSKTMIYLSNGVEVSEDTIVSALKKAGINVEPKHVFEAGDVVESGNFSNRKRIILQIDGMLKSYNLDGFPQSTGQQQFEANGYKFIGKLKDLLK